MSNNTSLQVGSLVKLIKPFDGVKIGVCAYVYHTEPDYLSADQNAAYLITSAGMIIGRMSVTGQNQFLRYVGDSGYAYKYDGDVKLKRDWMDDILVPAFSKCNADF